MLYEFLFSFSDVWSVFNVFRYITFRSALAAATAFVICLAIGPWIISRLQRLSIRQAIREEGPSSHRAKAGTPTMGGVLILSAVIVATLAWADMENPFIWVMLMAAVGFGMVGFVDDLSKVLAKRNLGLSARGKMGFLLFVALVLALWMFYLVQKQAFISELYFPFFKEFHPDLGLLFIPFAMLVMLGTSNAVNLTDGLDGLAIGSSGIAFASFTLIAYLAGHARMAIYLDIPHIVAASELVVFGAATCGAALGFLWFNAHPAEVFMGDTGALALGGTLGCMALLTGHSLLLIVVGGLFVLEAASVILQVVSYQWRGKRLFRMAPLHHHFELKGWHESKVIIRFWIVALLCSLLALSTFKVR